RRALGASRPVVAAAVGLVDRVNALLFGRNLVTPLANVVWKILGSRSVLRFLPSRMILVGVHATARGMDDQYSLGPRRGDRLIHERRQFSDAARGPATPVLIPHVADDDRRLRGVPSQDLFAGN